MCHTCPQGLKIFQILVKGSVLESTESLRATAARPNVTTVESALFVDFLLMLFLYDTEVSSYVRTYIRK